MKSVLTKLGLTSPLAVPAAVTSPPPVKARVLLPAVASGLLLWTAFFPLDLGPVAFVAMVPFLTLVRAENVGPTRRYLSAFVGGLVFYFLALKWIRVAHPMMAYFAWPGLSVYCALYWPLALLLLRRLDRLKLPLAVTFPVVWVALEYFRMHFPTGFPLLQYVHLHQLTGFGWYALGYSQHAVLPLLQAADLGGVYLVSAAVAAANGGVYEWFVRSRLVRRLLRWPAPPYRREWVREAYVSALAFTFPVALICYGTMQLVHQPFEKGPRVAALQGNVPQNEKMIRGEQKGDEETPPLAVEYERQARLAMQHGPNTPAPDLVIWPETCWPDNWFSGVHGVPGDPQVPDFEQRTARYQQGIGRAAAALTGTNNLLGLNTQEWDGQQWRKYNSAVQIRPDGSYAGRYDKIHLVPFGEYVPLRETFPWMKTFTPYTHDYSCTPGESWTRFELPAAKGQFHYGVLVCYEDTDPMMARRYNPSAGHGPGVDFLVNISNDGWFDGTEEHEQHLAVCRFRAVEARRSVVRAVNMGISAVIDPDGKVVALPAEESWEASKKTRGIVRADVPLDRRGSLYAYAGDWVPGLFWALIVAGLVTVRVRGQSCKPA